MSFREEIDWFKENQGELKKKYPGKVAVVFNKTLQGTFPDNMAALLFRTENFPREDEVLIRPVDHIETITVIPSVFSHSDQPLPYIS